MKRTCKECKTEYEAENTEEMKKYFYMKKTWTGNYLLNTCKECEKAKHRDKYKSGQYNLKKKRASYADEAYSIGGYAFYG